MILGRSPDGKNQGHMKVKVKVGEGTLKIHMGVDSL